MFNRFLFFAAVTAMVTFPAAASTNLVVNGSFDQNDLTGWRITDPQNTKLEWRKSDSFHVPTSGSLAVTANVAVVGTGSLRNIYQCVPITPGAAYDLSVRVMIEGGQNEIGASAAVYTHQSSDCSGNNISMLYTPTFSKTSNGGFTPLAARNRKAPDNAHSARVLLYVDPRVAGSGNTVHFDDVFFGPTGGCVPDDTTACLDGGRFAVQAQYNAPGGAPKNAHIVQLTPDAAYMWFNDDSNVEITMKMLNACAVSPSHWLFASGLTNLAVTITVKDTVTTATKTYTNAQGDFFQPQFDTSAFACP